MTPSHSPGTADQATDVTSTAAARPFHPVIDIAGRLSLRYDRNGAEQAIDGKFTWHQTPDATRIVLSTPFGQTLATIDITPAGAVLRQANQVPRMATDVDSLTASALGWPLPVAGLRDWLQGFARDQRGQPYVAAATAAGDAAWVTTADGWLIHYPSWETDSAEATDAAAGSAASSAARHASASVATESHPKRIDLQRQTSQAGKVALRIVIDQWQPV